MEASMEKRVDIKVSYLAGNADYILLGERYVLNIRRI